jgi:hypothetical protein
MQNRSDNAEKQFALSLLDVEAKDFLLKTKTLSICLVFY